MGDLCTFWHTDLIYLTEDTDRAIQIQIQRYRSESRTRAAFYAQMQQVARQRIHWHIIFNMLKPQLIRVQITHGDIHSQMCVLVCIGRCVCVRVCGFNFAGLSVVIEFRLLNR